MLAHVKESNSQTVALELFTGVRLFFADHMANVLVGRRI